MIARGVYYILVWGIICSGLTFILAAAFFGFPSDEKDGK